MNNFYVMLCDICVVALVVFTPEQLQECEFMWVVLKKDIKRIIISLKENKNN